MAEELIHPASQRARQALHEGPEQIRSGQIRPEESGFATSTPGLHRAARWVGLLTSFVAVLPVFLSVLRRPELLRRPTYLLWLGLFILFVATFWTHKNEWPKARSLAWLAAMSVAAVGMAGLIPHSLHGVLLVIVAASLGLSIGSTLAGAWVLLQTLAFGLLLLRVDHPLDAGLTALAFLGFQLFALYVGVIAERERLGRETLARTNSELVATRRLLEESSRAAERLRISRDLHDVLGHHLTALALHLETARHAPPEPAAASLETAHGITRRLLGEVRAVVGALRDESTLHLGPALTELTEGVDRPRIHLALPAGFGERLDLPRAEALLRCVQEIITNTVRHAEAETLWIDITQTPEAIRLAARDDGRGASAGPTEGHGLRGMRERVERLGGSLETETPPGEGFRLRVHLPRSIEADA